METEVTFKSKLFYPLLPNTSQVNPDRYGAELAWWLCRELVKVGIVTSYPYPQDWGWYIEYINDAGDAYWLCCGNVDGSGEKWLCFINPRGKGLFGWKKPSIQKAWLLLEALRQILETESSISDIQWPSEQL